MILALVLFSIALAVQPAFSYPLGGIYADTAQSFDIQTDFDAYSGPWNYGNRFWSGGLGGGFGGGLGGGYGGILGGSRGLIGYDTYSDNFDYDIGYTIEPSRRVDVGRDRVVRDFAVTETDNWVRDTASYRTPTRVRYATVPTRRVYTTSGIVGPRTSSLRTGGDLFFLRR